MYSGAPKSKSAGEIPMNAEMQKRALAARDAHLALLELKKLVEDAAQATHDAEFEAIHLAIDARRSGESVEFVDGSHRRRFEPGRNAGSTIFVRRVRGRRFPGIGSRVL